MPKGTTVKQMTLPEFRAKFATERACKLYLARKRWPEGTVRCPRCTSSKVYALTFKAFHWQCHQCAEKGYRFSILTGTIFENTNVKLTVWFEVIYYMMMSKKGISALQIQKMMGLGSYRTAWSMCHRIRAGMADESLHQLTGIVEMDEAYIGGKDEWKHKNKRGGPRGGKGKMPVIGAVERGGNVVARVIDRVNSKTIARFAAEVISHRVSLMCTDSSRKIPMLPKRNHQRVNHAAGQYVLGPIHTNTIEGFWSQFKRGVVGAYHKVTRKYLPLYVAEAAFRYNHRMDEDIFGAAVATV